MSTKASMASISVSGQRDPIIRTLRRLKTSGGRAKEGLYLAEGPDLCHRVLTYGGTLSSLICTEAFAASAEGLALRALLPSGCAVYTASQGLIGKCLEAKPTPQCIGLVLRVETPFEEMLQTQNPLFIAVDHGESADNLGMLLRSAEASGVEGVLLGQSTVDPFSRRVTRGARGATFHLPLCLDVDLLSMITTAQESGLQVITTSANTETLYTEVDFTRPSFVIIGNEHRGVSRAVIERSDQCVRIPMAGKINSLNIAVAGSLILFEARRQRALSLTQST
jgi:RNA methyltransferase, TrmH family